MPGLAAHDRWLYGWGVGYAAVGAASLLVPLYAIELGAGPFLVAIVASTAAFAGVPGALVWGRLATLTGRRRAFLVASLALTALSLAAVALTTSLVAVVALNALLWFAVSAAAPVLALLVVDGTPEARWDARIGLLNTAQGYGWVVGLLAGAAWNVAVAAPLGDVLAQRAFFALAAGATVAGLAVTARYLPERPSVTEARLDQSLRALTALVRGGASRTLYAPVGASRGYWALRRLHPVALARRLSTDLGLYLLAVLCAFTGFAVFFGPLPAFLRGVGYSTDQVFALFLASNAASALLYATVGRLATAHGAERIQLGALSVRVVLFPAVAVVGAVGAASFPVLVALFAAVGATWAVVAVTATGIVTRLAPPAVRGNALGAYTALGGVGTGVGSLLGGALAGALSYTVAFGVAGLLVLVGAALALVEYRRRSVRPRDDLRAPAGRS